MKKNNFIEGTFIATASVVAVKVLGMLYVIPFYMIVGSKGGALYSYAYNIYLIFLSISSAGIPSAMSKIISEYNVLGKTEAKVRAYNLGKKFIGIISIIAFIILFIFARSIANIIIGDLTGGNTIEDVTFVIRCVSFAVLIIPHLSVTRGYLQAHKYITPSSNSNLIEQVVRIFVILTGAFLAYKVLNSSLTLAVGIAVSGAFFGGLIAYIYLKRIINKNKELINLDKEYKKDNITNKEIIRKIGTYALPFIIINLVINIYNFTNMVLILRTLNNLGYSAYDVEFITSVITTWGAKLGMIVNSIAMGMSITLVPSIVEAYTKKDFDDVGNKFNKALQIIVFISMPLTLGISVLSTPVWTVFYNTNPYGGAILKVLIFTSLVVNINMIVGTTLQSMNKFKYVYKTNIAGFLLNAILVIPFMHLFNKINIPPYFGAIAATLLSYIVSIYIGVKAIGDDHKISYKETYIQSLKILIPSMAMTVVLVIINKLLSLNVYSRSAAIQEIILNIIVGGLIYVLVSYKLKIPHTIFGEAFINKITNKFKRGKHEA